MHVTQKIRRKRSLTHTQIYTGRETGEQRARFFSHQFGVIKQRTNEAGLINEFFGRVEVVEILRM